MAAQLAGEIAARHYPLGSRFPAEQALQDRFGVGRHTVREALKVLSEQGLLGRRRRTGTVVLAHQPVEHYIHSLRDLHGLFDFARDTGLAVQYEGFASAKPARPQPQATPGQSAGQPLDRLALSQPGSGRWFRVAGVRSTRSDGRPLCWSEILIPELFAPDRAALRQGADALYALVMRQHGLKLSYVEQQISAAPLPPELARLLAAEPGGAALLVRRRYVAHTGATFEVSHNTYPADRYAITSVIRQRA
ncbi:MAG: GntR family transcriptional regulator [Janthinobacterium lividum]